jgi:hypothetical protein
LPERVAPDSTFDETPEVQIAFFTWRWHTADKGKETGISHEQL